MTGDDDDDNNKQEKETIDTFPGRLANKGSTQANPAQDTRKKRRGEPFPKHRRTHVLTPVMDTGANATEERESETTRAHTHLPHYILIGPHHHQGDPNRRHDE